MYSWHFTNQKNSIEKETKNTYLYLANSVSKFRMLKKIKSWNTVKYLLSCLKSKRF